MIIKIGKNVIHYYNKEKDIFIISHLEAKESPVYTIEGWFAKKLHNFCEGSGNLENFLEQELKNEHENQEDIFERLIGTLLDKDLLTYRGDSPFSLTPLSEDEYSNFGQEKWRGSLTIKRFSDQEILAYSHGSHSSCLAFHKHTSVSGPFGGAASWSSC